MAVKKIDFKSIIYQIRNKGATWDDIENMTGCCRTTIQRKLKNEHYSTKEGYERLLKQVRKNVSDRKNMTTSERFKNEPFVHKQQISDKDVAESLDKKQPTSVLLADTSYLFKVKSEGKSLSDLMKEYQIVYIPQRCINELVRASHNDKKPSLKNAAKELLEEITSKNFDEKLSVIYEEKCRELLVYPISSEQQIKDRTKEVVAALCSLYREKKDVNITCLTATAEIAKWARLQKFPYTVTIRCEEAAHLD